MVFENFQTSPNPFYHMCNQASNNLSKFHFIICSTKLQTIGRSSIIPYTCQASNKSVEVQLFHILGQASNKSVEIPLFHILAKLQINRSKFHLSKLQAIGKILTLMGVSPANDFTKQQFFFDVYDNNFAKKRYTFFFVIDRNSNNFFL